MTGSELPADHMALHHGSPRPGLSTALWERRRGSHGGTAPPSTELPVSTAWRGLWVLLVHLGMPPRVTVTPPSKAEDRGCRDCELAARGLGQGPQGCGLALHAWGLSSHRTRESPLLTAELGAPYSPDSRPRGRPPDSSAAGGQTSVPRRPGPPVTAHQRAAARGASRAPVPAPTTRDGRPHCQPATLVTRGHRRPRTQRGPGPGRQSLPPRPLAGPETTRTKPADLRPPLWLSASG